MRTDAPRIHLDMPLDWRFGRDILLGLLQFNRGGRCGWGVTCHLWKQEEVWNLKEHQLPDVVVGSFQYAERAKKWLEKGVRVLNIAGVEAPPEGVCTVTADNETAGRMAAEYFLERGFQHFAYLTSTHSPASNLRKRGFLEGLGEVKSFEELDQLKPEPMRAFFAQLASPAAVFCFTDQEARYAALILQPLGRAVPGDIALLGVNDDPIDGGLSPVPLSSIDIRPLEIGLRTGESIHTLLNGGEIPELQLIQPGSLVERASSDVYALKDRSVAEMLQRIRERACEGIRVRDVFQPRDGSRRGMEMKFKRLLGRTIEGEIRRCRLEASREMLLNTNRSIAEVAESCGFCNTPHFSRMFKETYGLTPGEYRR